MTTIEQRRIKNRDYWRNKPRQLDTHVKAYSAYLSKLARAEKWITTCPQCGTRFRARQTGRKFCRQTCSAKYISSHPSETIIEQREAWKKHYQPKLHAAAMRKIKGAHGFGVMEAGNKKHALAKFYRLRSPLGEVIEVKNLKAWCKENEHIFTSSGAPVDTITPLHDRAKNGLYQVSNGVSCSWHGWTAVCVFDAQSDPLARQVA